MTESRLSGSKKYVYSPQVPLPHSPIIYGDQVETYGPYPHYI